MDALSELIWVGVASGSLVGLIGEGVKDGADNIFKTTVGMTVVARVVRVLNRNIIRPKNSSMAKKKAPISTFTSNTVRKKLRMISCMSL